MDVLPMLVDRQEAAQVLRCSEAVLDRLVDTGDLLPVKLETDDAAQRFRPEDLLDLVERRVAERTGWAMRCEMDLARARGALAHIGERTADAKARARVALPLGGAGATLVNDELRVLARERNRASAAAAQAAEAGMTLAAASAVEAVVAAAKHLLRLEQAWFAEGTQAEARWRRTLPGAALYDFLGSAEGLRVAWAQAT